MQIKKEGISSSLEINYLLTDYGYKHKIKIIKYNKQYKNILLTVFYYNKLQSFLFINKIKGEKSQ